MWYLNGYDCWCFSLIRCYLCSLCVWYDISHFVLYCTAPYPTVLHHIEPYWTGGGTAKVPSSKPRPPPFATYASSFASGLMLMHTACCNRKPICALVSLDRRQRTVIRDGRENVWILKRYSAAIQGGYLSKNRRGCKHLLWQLAPAQYKAQHSCTLCF